MEGNNPDNKILKKSAQEVQSVKLPPPRFGHSVNLISKTSIVIFGGAISTSNNKPSYTMKSNLYLYNMALNYWKYEILIKLPMSLLPMYLLQLEKIRFYIMEVQ